MNWVVLQSGYVPPVEITIAVLGILVTVLTVYGALIRYLYDQTTSLDHLLNGANGNDGFIKETQNAHQELAQSQREIERTLRAHGALLQELVYTLRRVAENMEEEDNIDELDTRRLEHLEEALKGQGDLNARAPDYGQSEYESEDEDADD